MPTIIQLTSQSDTCVLPDDLSPAKRHLHLWQAARPIVAEVYELLHGGKAQTDVQDRLNRLQIDLFRLYVASGCAPDDKDDWRHRDSRFIEVLMAANDRLAYKMARRFQTPETPSSQRELDDTLQTARRAMLQSMYRFDPSRNYEFSSYAVSYIRGQLMNSLDQFVHPAKACHNKLHDMLALGRAIRDNGDVLPPRDQMDPRFQNMADSYFTDLVNMYRTRHGYSLNQPLGTDDDADGKMTLVDIFSARADGQAPDDYDRVIDRHVVHAALAQLDERSRDWVIKRFVHGYNWKQLAAISPLSESRTRNLTWKAIAQMRQFIEAESPVPA